MTGEGRREEMEGEDAGEFESTDAGILSLPPPENNKCKIIYILIYIIDKIIKMAKIYGRGMQRRERVRVSLG